MKAYKITGKLGDICSFVGGNEVKKGDMVYFHSESDMKQQCVDKPQENDMSIEAMKQALEALETPWMSYTEDGCDIALGKRLSANTALRQAIEQASSVSSIQSDKTSDAEKQEPVAWMIWLYGLSGLFEHKQLAELEFSRRNEEYPDEERKLVPLYTAPLDSIKSSKTLDAQPRREWVGLTDEEIKKFWRAATVKPCYTSELIDNFARAIEAKLKEKNSAT